MKKTSRRISFLFVLLTGLLMAVLAVTAACGGGGTYAIGLDRDSVSMKVGDVITLVAEVTLDGEATETAAEWSSSDPTVASVENGKVTALKEGETRITASAEGVSAVCEVTVAAAEFTVSLDKAELALFVGESAQLSASSSDGVTREYVWTSSDPTVAGVENGNVTALAEGTAMITASAAGKSASCAVTVEEEDVFLILSKESAALKAGETLTLTASLTNGAAATVEWSSSDPTVAGVENGVVTALKAGTAKITADAGEGLTAVCTVTVTDVYELIFPALPEFVFVGEEIDLGLVLRQNGQEASVGEAEITGNGFDVSDGTITPRESGMLNITVTYRDQKQEQSVAAYIEVADAEDLAAVNDGLSDWYKLTADIDFEGGKVETIAHYSDGNSSASSGFLGVFDGNGYSIMNFTPVYKGALGGNCALFGWIGESGVVRNLNVLNASIEGRISGGIVNTNYGLVENCFVSTVVNYQPATGDTNNPIGAVCSKNYGDIRNTIAVLTLGEVVTDSSRIGGFVGRHLGGSSMTNCYSLTELGFTEEAKPTNGDMNGTLTACGTFATLAELHEAVDPAVFVGWTLDESAYPHLGEIAEEILPEQTAYETFAGTSVTISVQSRLPVLYALAEEAPDAVLDGNVLSIGKEAAAGAQIKVRVYSLYDADAEKEIVVAVRANDYAVTAEVDSAEFTVIEGEEGEWSKDLGIVVTLNGEEVQEGFEIRSADPSVATVEGDVVTCVGDGTTAVEVVVDGTVLLMVKIVCNLYHPVRTTADFLAIGTNSETMAAKYILMNDLDFEGARVEAFSSYKTAGTVKFTGIFDGNGYTISNIEPYANAADSTDRDRAIFGYMDGGAVVRNVAFTGVRAADRFALVANWVQNGVIENVYAEVVYDNFPGFSDNANKNNPAGVIAAKVHNGAVRNCVVVLTVAEGAYEEFMGGIVGQNNGAALENCILVYDAREGEELKPVYSGSGTAQTFSDIDAMYDAETGADLSAFDGELWVFEEGYLPHFKKMTDEIVISVPDTIYQGSETEVTLVSGYAARLSMQGEIEGVTFENGILIVGAEVPAGTQIVFTAVSLYLPGIEAEKTIVVAVNAYDLELDTPSFIFKWIGGKDENGNPYSPSEAYTATIVYTIMQNGKPYEGEISLVSADITVATVSGNVVTALADGKTEIVIMVGGAELGRISVNSEMYIPIRTAEELDAIDTDRASLSKKYVLMNDIDFEGGKVETIAHYSDGNSSASSGFLGVFDGNGYSIMNFTPVYKGALGGNCALFGWIGESGVVRNLNVLNASIEGRISGGIVNTNYGLVENCFVSTVVNYQPATGDTNNPIGAVCSKNYGDIRNTIAVLTLGEVVTDSSRIGGFVGRHLGGSSMTNCYSLTELGFTEEAKPTNGDMNGTLTACGTFADAGAFFAEGTGADLSAFDGDIWQFDAQSGGISLKKGCFGK